MGELLSLFEKPKTTTKRTPRSYQQALFDAWEARKGEGRGKLAVLATGLGKTYIASQIVRRTPGRALFLCNRTELRRQAMETLADDSGRRWQVEQADQWASVNGSDSVVALVQSMIQPHAAGKRYMRFQRDAFSLIVIDEVHRMMSDESKSVLEYFETAELLGLTATPAGKDYQPLFTVDVFNYPLAKALREAWSVDFEYRTYHAPTVKLDDVEWSGGDWSRRALDEAMTHAAAAIAKAAVDECDDLKTLVFCPGIRCIEAATDAINKAKPESARALHSKLSDFVKASTIRDHKAGKFQYLVSCDMVREGYDDPEVQCILLAKPMGQAHDYEQVIGRGSRLWPGLGSIEVMDARASAIAASPKPRCRLVDLACVSERHAVVSVTDVLGGDYTDRERALAKKSLIGDGIKDKSRSREGSERDPLKALEWAKRELEFRDALAEQAKKAKVELRRKEKADPNGPPTEGELRKLKELGLPSVSTHAEAVKAVRRAYSPYSCTAKMQSFAREWLGVIDPKPLSRAEYAKRVKEYQAGGNKRLLPR